MRRIIIAGFVALWPIAGMAQQPAPMAASPSQVEIENQYLSQELTQAIQQYTKAAAMLTLERSNSAKAQAELAYWHEWCGSKPGCAK